MRKKHILLMVACCLVPVIALGAIFLLQIPASKVLWTVLVLLCPISHLFMFKFMGHEHDAVHLHAQPKLSEPTQPQNEA